MSDSDVYNAQIEHNSTIVGWGLHRCNENTNNFTSMRYNITDNILYLESYIGEVRIPVNCCPFCGNPKTKVLTGLVDLYKGKRGFF